MQVFAAAEVQTYWGWSLEDWRNVFLIFSSLVLAPLAFILALWRARIANRQTNLSEQAANLDRFQKGAQMLGDKRLSVRQAGIIILNDLAKSELEKHSKQRNNLPLNCAEVLEKFIADRGHEIPVTEDRGHIINSNPISADAQFALEVLIKINATTKKPINLQGANLTGAYLANAMLRYAKLNQVMLDGAYLEGANLDHATLTDASLTSANLKNTKLRRTNMNRADLYSAKLYSADIRGSKLVGAIFKNSSLHNAILLEANLRHADFSGADLSGTHFPEDIESQMDYSRIKFEEASAYTEHPPKNLPKSIKLIEDDIPF